MIHCDLTGKSFDDEMPLPAESSLNFCKYVHNDPVNFVDPNGLQELDATDTTAAVRHRKAELITLIGKEESIHKESAYYDALGVSHFFKLMRDTIENHVDDVVENAWFQGSALAHWDPTFENIELPGTINNAHVLTVIHKTVHAYNHWKHPNTYAANNSLDEGMAYGTSA